MSDLLITKTTYNQYILFKSMHCITRATQGKPHIAENSGVWFQSGYVLATAMEWISILVPRNNNSFG